ncbi:MAG: D-Ala-D-Ala carboxypeptidase family metallohydrolase [Oscillospiraceae bacterium]
MEGYPVFQARRISLPCGRCGGFPVEPQESIARTVDEIRHRLGIPISIVDGGGSGVWCAAHNAEVGGVADSQHLYWACGGSAQRRKSGADAKPWQKMSWDIQAESGLYSWGIHVDKRSGYARWNG